MRNDPWLALLAVGLVVLIAGPLALNAEPSEIRIAVFGLTPPVILAGLVWLQRARPDSERKRPRLHSGRGVRLRRNHA